MYDYDKHKGEKCYYPPKKVVKCEKEKNIINVCIEINVEDDECKKKHVFDGRKDHCYDDKGYGKEPHKKVYESEKNVIMVNVCINVKDED